MSQKKIKFDLKSVVPYSALIIVFLLFSITTGGSFIRLSNIRLILVQCVIVIIAGIGSTFTLSHGNIDFSAGGELVITCLVAFYVSKVDPALMIPAAIITGILISVLIGALHIAFEFPTFILGICVMFIGQGVIKMAQNAEKTMKTPSMYTQFDTMWTYLIAIVVMFAIGYFIFEKTKIGKFNKAIGSNRVAAKLSGIPVNKYKIYAFIISGFMKGVASALYLIKAGGLTRSTGNMLQIDILIAMVLGGVSLNGGSTVKMLSIVVGALIQAMMANGMIMWGFGPTTVNIIQALIFLVAVSLTYDRSTGYIS